MLEVPLRLRRAIHVDNLPIVVRILKNHPNALPTPDIPGNTSLHLAASWGRLNITKFLVEREGVAAISRRNNDGDTPLLLAAAAGHDDVVAYLAAKGGREALDTKNRLGFTPLMAAAVAGVDGVVNTLLDYLADPELIDALGNTTLHYASAYGHEKIMRTLVERGVTVDRQNRQGWRPISYSCTWEAERFFEQLIQEREVRYLQAGASGVQGERERERVRAPTPVPARSDWPIPAAAIPPVAVPATVMEVVGGRPRASSGS